MFSQTRLISSIVLVLLCSSVSNSQDFGVVIGYASSNALIAGGHVIHDNFLVRFCVSLEPSDVKGEEVSEQKSNYGRTIEGSGDYFTTYDIGLGYYLTPKMTITGEISLGQKKYYINYSDNRFTDGGYHLIIKSESLYGVGFGVGYIIDSGFGLLIGYNTVREFSFGITYDF
jgi:hypothetical protein